MVNRTKLRQVVSAVFNLFGKDGVKVNEVNRYLMQRDGESQGCVQALRTAVDEGFLCVKNKKYYPLLLSSVEDVIEARRRRGRSRNRKRMTRRRRKRKGHYYSLEARRRRRSRKRSRSRRRGRRSYADLLAARRRRRARQYNRRRRRRRSIGKRHGVIDVLGELFNLRRRRKRKTSRRTRRRFRRREEQTMPAKAEENSMKSSNPSTTEIPSVQTPTPKK
uniref:Uncharacterized protein n=1 Tax=Cuerna arida TaxID=1464854 RepID=A0A1B6FL58_9HEMI